MKYSKEFEEPAECLDCGLWLEAYDLIVDPDLQAFCPQCHNDNIKFYRPKEDCPRCLGEQDERIRKI